jgi:hypothetical protein
MRILVNKFVDNKPSAREITLGYTTFWFAGEHMIAMKYLSNMYGKYPSSGYASQIREYLPKYMISNDWNKYMKSVMPLYMDVSGKAPKVVQYAGTTTNAFAILFGGAKVYFSYDHMIGFDAYDKSFALDRHLTPPMKRHLEILKAPGREVEIVNEQALMAAFDRYFHQFESSISCL